ncbi:MAG: DNA gyrase subunit A, partial [Candidatus Heimdallarchaeota archaeon]|nr:DNA gyrase subunit A [Candidatus Heimdallarchaeota archaeon]
IGDFNEEDMIKDEAVLITLTERGYVKRIPAETFRSQARGGKGVIGTTMKDEDEVAMLIPARSKETLLFFSNRGKVYSVKAYRIPEASRTAKGTSILNVLALGADETITAAVRVKSFKNSEFCIMTTKKGKTKRVALYQFKSVRPSGLIAMNLADGDELGWVRLTSGKDDVIIITRNGKALRFFETNVRAMGRQAGGVIGIKIIGDDEVTSMEVVEKDSELLVITENGYGKRTALDKYVTKGRGTLGVKTVDTKAFKKIGKVAAARVVKPSDELTVISANGVVMRTTVENISTAGRATMGVKIMNINEGDSVSTVARTSADDLKQIIEEK